MMKITQIVLAGSIMFFTWLLLRSGMTTQRYIAVSLVWLCAGFLVLAESRLEIFKIILQSAGVLLAFAAFVISILTFSIQQTPLLVLRNFNIVEGEQRLYLFFQNKGAIAAYSLRGAFVVTTHQEPTTSKTANEKILAFEHIDTQGQAFYPNTDIEVISVPITIKEKIADQSDFVYFSIAINYPRLEIGSFEIPPRKGYEGVFMYDKSSQRWVRSTKTQLPEFFNKVFLALKKGEAPNFQAVSTRN